MRVKAKVNLIPFVIPSKFLQFGWGNGYVAMDKFHPLYGLGLYGDNTEVAAFISIYIHGGITFTGWASSLNIPEKYNIPENYWIIGFDTAHTNDTLEKWPDEQSVMEETLKLKDQLIKIYNKC